MLCRAPTQHSNTKALQGFVTKSGSHIQRGGLGISFKFCYTFFLILLVLSLLLCQFLSTFHDHLGPIGTFTIPFLGQRSFSDLPVCISQKHFKGISQTILTPFPKIQIEQVPFNKFIQRDSFPIITYCQVDKEVLQSYLLS